MITHFYIFSMLCSTLTARRQIHRVCLSDLWQLHLLPADHAAAPEQRATEFVRAQWLVRVDLI